VLQHAGHHLEQGDWNEAFRRTGLDGDDPGVRGLLNLKSGWSFAGTEIFVWVESLAPEVRRSTLRLAAHLLGVKEARRRAQCGVDCRHWWHRDLHDPKVVDDLLRKAGPKPSG
jgi:hypothetical protein